MLDEIFSKLKSPKAVQPPITKDLSKSPKSGAGSPSNKFDFNADWGTDDNLLLNDELPEYPEILDQDDL